MEHGASSFTSLLVVVFAAFAVPVTLYQFKRLRLPIVVGEILAGILIGPSVLKWVSPNEPILDFLAQLGFVFLMFLSGMEIDFSRLNLSFKRTDVQKSSPWSPLTIAAMHFVLTLLLGAAAGFGLARLGLARNPWLMGLILSTTSLGIVVPVLKERGLSSSRFGQTILLAALIADFATMFLITVLVAVLSQGLTLDILLIGILFVTFFVLSRFGQLFNRLPGVRRVLEDLSHATSQIKIRAAFTLMLIFIVLSEVLGVEIILGAFLAGVCVALLIMPDDVHVARELETIGYGFLIPLFFIKVGIDFDLTALLASSNALVLMPLLIVAAVAVKVLPGLIFRLQYSWRETLAGGTLLSARLSLIIAASAIGVRLGIISDSTNAAVLLVAILTVTFAPVFFSALVPLPDVTTRSPLVIVGGGELGMQVAQQLQAHRERVVVLDDNVERVTRARQSGFESFAVSFEKNDSQTEKILNGIQTLICTYGDTDKNYEVCHAARVDYGIPHVVARVSTPGDLVRFEQLGVRTVNAALDHAALLTLLARNPATYELLTRADESKEIVEVLVSKDDCIGRRLRHLHLPGDTLVLAVRRNGTLLVPDGSTQLEKGDYLTLLGSVEWVGPSRQMFEASV
jgi:CPA2 family monovalent cation:H+ antiporter-2